MSDVLCGSRPIEAAACHISLSSTYSASRRPTARHIRHLGQLRYPAILPPLQPHPVRHLDRLRHLVPLSSTPDSTPRPPRSPISASFTLSSSPARRPALITPPPPRPAEFANLGQPQHLDCFPSLPGCCDEPPHRRAPAALHDRHVSAAHCDDVPAHHSHPPRGRMPFARPPATASYPHPRRVARIASLDL